MNIETNKLNSLQKSQQNINTSQAQSDVSFKDELNELDKASETFCTKEESSDLGLEGAVEDLNDVVNEMNKKTLDQSEYNSNETLKNTFLNTDNTEKGAELINRDLNIQENKEILPQMNPNMNFSGDGQPFSSFMNEERSKGSNLGKLDLNTSDLMEEAAILSTMAENIAIANKNNLLIKNSTNEEVLASDLKETTVHRNDGIKKIDIQSGITIETVVKYDSIIVNEADVEVFANLVEKGEVNLNNLAPQAAEKSINVSKTLADMLFKAKENNQPLRIDFDNNISVIIRISRDGKISADFLPSSQIAEAYLKENLPLLRQKFEDNNIKYDELNQRERKESNKEQNKKKGRNDE